MFGLPIENIRQIVQTPGNLVIYSEQANDVRIVGIGDLPQDFRAKSCLTRLEPNDWRRARD